MLTELDVKRIHKLIKIIKETTINFPDFGEKDQYHASSKSTNESFVINIVRGSRIKPQKATYQFRTEGNDILFRVDLDGPDHPNPDGIDVPCPHLHVYKYDGTPYFQNWAFPLLDKIPTNVDDLIQVFVDFLKYNNIEEIPMIINKMDLV